jgi:hypothetical protein
LGFGKLELGVSHHPPRVALLVLAAVGFERGKVSFVAAGLAAFAFPFFWDALADV